MRPFIVILFTLLSLFSCVHRQSETILPELVRAKSLMYDHPDSALALLDSMPVPPSSNSLQYATWCLLITQAQDKNYVAHTSDSLINVAYQYFMKQNDMERKALTLNYKGRVNEDLGQIEEATNYFLAARDAIRQTSDYRLGFLVHSNLGHIYAYRGLYEEAMLAFREANQCALQSNDSNYISLSFSYIGRVYGATADWENSVSSYKQAIEVAEQGKEKKALSGALSELAAIYRKMAKYDLALICSKKAKKMKEEMNSPDIYQTYLGLGNTYQLTEQYDSATYYLKKALQTDRIYTLQSTYQALCFLNEKQGNYKEALAYNNQFLICQDSINKLGRSQDISEIQARYDHEKLINVNNRLTIERDRSVKYGLIVSIFFVCLLALLIYLYQRKLMQKRETIEKNKEELRLRNIKLRKNEAVISRNNARIAELIEQREASSNLQIHIEEQSAEIEQIKKQNNELQHENNKLQDRISEDIQLVQQKNSEMEAYNVLSEQNAKLRDREVFLCTQLTKRMDELNKLRTSPRYIEPERWEEVIEAVNFLHDKYTHRLCSRFTSLSDSDLQICCLVKLRLSNTTIATLAGISPGSVTKRKQRLKDRFNEELGELPIEGSLDIWLREY